jgi:microcystin-dependent protein
MFYDSINTEFGLAAAAQDVVRWGTDLLLRTRASIDVCELDTGDRDSSIDLHASDDAGQADYSARLHRASGVDGLLTLENLGDGGVDVVSVGSQSMKVDGFTAATVTSTGVELFGDITLPSNSVDTDSIDDEAVTTEKIDDEAVTLAKLAAEVIAQMSLTGEIKTWSTGVAPTGYLLCNAGSYDTTAQADLFAVIGYTYGGSGANFNVPDGVDRSPMGAGGTVALGAVTGAATHTLTTGEMPSHGHNFNQYVTENNEDTTGSELRVKPTGKESSTTANKGGDGAHNNLHPVFGVNYIIKT